MIRIKRVCSKYAKNPPGELEIAVHQLILTSDKAIYHEPAAVLSMAPCYRTEELLGPAKHTN